MRRPFSFAPATLLLMPTQGMRNQPAAHFIPAYATWTVEFWDTDGHPLALRDLMVMQAGIAGESSEVSELLIAGKGKPDMTELRLEVGDVVYYWCRMCEAFQLNAAALWPLGDPAPHAGEDVDVLSAAMLGICAGKVSEVLKKHVRDRSVGKFLFGAPPGLEKQLVQLALELARIMNRHGLVFEDVLQTNKAKLTERRAKKTEYAEKYGQ